MPTLSPDAWAAAHRAAERAIPVLLAKGFIHHAAQLAERAKVFAVRAA